jgi:hypothetical protein
MTFVNSNDGVPIKLTKDDHLLLFVSLRIGLISPPSRPSTTLCYFTKFDCQTTSILNIRIFIPTLPCSFLKNQRPFVESRRQKIFRHDSCLVQPGRITTKVLSPPLENHCSRIPHKNNRISLDHVVSIQTR